MLVYCLEEVSVSVSRRDQTWRDRDQDPRDRDRDRDLTTRDRDRDRDLEPRDRDRGHENVGSRGLDTETWSRDLTSLLFWGLFPSLVGHFWTPLSRTEYFD